MLLAFLALGLALDAVRNGSGLFLGFARLDFGLDVGPECGF